jgi:hypothetical protein
LPARSEGKNGAQGRRENLSAANERRRRLQRWHSKAGIVAKLSPLGFFADDFCRHSLDCRLQALYPVYPVVYASLDTGGELLREVLDGAIMQAMHLNIHNKPLLGPKRCSKSVLN